MPPTVFDAIVAGDIPCDKLYEDDRVLAFLDINPLREGHALVIPKKGAPKIEELDPADAAAIMTAAQQIVPRLVAATGAQDATLAIHDGPAAGQEVPHVHLHIIPRKPGDGGGPIHALFLEDRPVVSGEERAALAAKVRSELVAEAA
ncbi:MAG: HIT family protein [Thermoplasmatota archaeon]